MVARLAWVLLCALAAAPGNAWAEPFDTFGGMPREAALSGADIVFANPDIAAQTNPATAINSPAARFTISYSRFSPRIALNGQTNRSLEDAAGLALALTVPWRIGPVEMGINLGTYFPEQRLVRIRIAPPSEPQFVRFENRVHRMEVLAAYALRWGPIAVGAGLGVFADALGDNVRLDLRAVPGEARRSAADLEVRLVGKYYPMAGITVEPLPNLRFGVAYRGGVDLGIRLGTTADIAVNPGPGLLSGTAGVGIVGTNYFTPTRVAFGAGYVLALPHKLELGLFAALHWERWSEYQGVIARTRIDLNLTLGDGPFVIDVLRTAPRDGRYRDTFNPSAGAELTAPVPGAVLSARIGYAYQPATTTGRPGVLNTLDTDRHVVSSGLGIELSCLRPWFPWPPTIDLAAQVQALTPRAVAKTDALSVLPGLRVAGFVAGGAGSVTLRF